MLSQLQGDLQQLQVQLVQRQLAEPGLALSPALLYGDLTPWAGDSIMLGMLRDVANGKGTQRTISGVSSFRVYFLNIEGRSCQPQLYLAGNNYKIARERNNEYNHLRVTSHLAVHSADLTHDQPLA